MGSAGAAAIAAQVVFWALLALGFWTRELSVRATAFVLAAYLIALLGGAYRPYWLPFSSCVAVLDIALVLKVAKADVWLS